MRDACSWAWSTRDALRLRAKLAREIGTAPGAKGRWSAGASRSLDEGDAAARRSGGIWRRTGATGVEGLDSRLLGGRPRKERRQGLGAEEGPAGVAPIRRGDG